MCDSRPTDWCSLLGSRSKHFLGACSLCWYQGYSPFGHHLHRRCKHQYDLHLLDDFRFPEEYGTLQLRNCSSLGLPHSSLFEIYDDHTFVRFLSIPALPPNDAHDFRTVKENRKVLWPRRNLAVVNLSTFNPTMTMRYRCTFSSSTWHEQKANFFRIGFILCPPYICRSTVPSLRTYAIIARNDTRFQYRFRHPGHNCGVVLEAAKCRKFTRPEFMIRDQTNWMYGEWGITHQNEL